MVNVYLKLNKYIIHENKGGTTFNTTVLEILIIG